MKIWAWLVLLLLPELVGADTRSPSAEEIRAAGNASSELIPLLVRWLDAYPESVEDWPIADFGLVIAHLVGVGQHHHPNAVPAAEAYARRCGDEVPLRLDRVAEALSLAARVRLQLGQNEAAFGLLSQGSELCDRGIESESEATYCAFLLRDLALLDMRSGRYDQPARDLDRALRRLEPYPRSAAWVVVLNSVADLACSRGEVDTCLERYRRATEVAEAQHGVDSATAAYGYLGVGWAAALAGDWGSARAFIERADRVWSRHLGPEHPRLADALIEYGELLRRAGDPRSAADVLRRAVDLRESRLGINAFDLPRALDALGLALLDLGELAAAGRALERSAAIRRQHHGEGHVDHARSFAGLARLAQARGDLPGARRHLARAIDLRQGHPGAKGSVHPAVAEDSSRLAELYIDDRPELALDLAARSKDALAVAYGEDHPTVARAWCLEARAHLAAGSDAIPSALRCEAVGRRHLRRVAAGLSERDLLDYARARPHGADVALEALLASPVVREERIRAVWQSIARSRAMVFDVLSERQKEVPDSPAARNLAVARQALARLLVLGPSHDSAAYGRRLAAARDRADRAERLLSIRFAATPHPPLDLPRILARLPAGDTLLAYRIFMSRSGRRLAAFLAVGGIDRVAAYDLGPWDPVEDDLRRWRRDFTGASEDGYRRRAAGLRRKIWDPVEPLLGSSGRVLVVPDGQLFLLSFPALPTADGYLVEKRPSFHVLGAERDLYRPAGAKLEAGRVLIVGDPDFGEPRPNPAAPPGSVPADFAALPGAREEAQAVADAWRRWIPGGEVRWLQGDAATENRWRRDATGASALHLATHGFFFDPRHQETPRRAMPSRTNTDARGVGGLTGAHRPPLPPLSGFALAHANRPSAGDGSRDGIVTREEIVGLDLASARLVVLSFCDSGLGETRTGEGIFGLTRAFRGAGAGSLVLALAPISDQSSKQFMERFYAGLLGDGLDVDRAVRQASLELLTRRRRDGADTHPFHWGAFVSLGLTDAGLGPRAK